MMNLFIFLLLINLVVDVFSYYQKIDMRYWKIAYEDYS